MVKVTCPTCSQPINLESDQHIGQRIVCHSCHTQLEVTWLFPVCLDYPETTESDSTYQKENFCHNSAISERDIDFKLGR
jgi:hypothetical protein